MKKLLFVAVATASLTQSAHGALAAWRRAVQVAPRVALQAAEGMAPRLRQVEVEAAEALEQRVAQNRALQARLQAQREALRARAERLQLMADAQQNANGLRTQIYEAAVRDIEAQAARVARVEADLWFTAYTAEGTAGAVGRATETHVRLRNIERTTQDQLAMNASAERAANAAEAKLAQARARFHNANPELARAQSMYKILAFGAVAIATWSDTAYNYVTDKATRLKNFLTGANQPIIKPTPEQVAAYTARQEAAVRNS